MRDLSTILRNRAGEARSVLLLVPDGGTRSGQACLELLGGDSLGESNVMRIAVSAEDRPAVWQTEAEDVAPKRTAVVDTGETVADGESAEEGSDPSVSVDVLASPLNPVELGMSIGRYLGAWEETPEQTRVCFESATALFETLGSREAIRLIDALDTRFEAVDAVAHYHVDPDALDDELLDALRERVDAVAEYENGWEVTESGAEDPTPATREIDSAPRTADVGRVPDRIAGEHTLDTLLELFSAPHRRYALYYLEEYPDEQVTLDTLTDAIIDSERTWGTDAPPANRDAISVSLVHTHLPKLAAEGIVSFDPDRLLIAYEASPDFDRCIEFVQRFERQ